MIKAHAMELVAELRSGRHEQGYYFLNAEGKKCCLGVACYLMGDKLEVHSIPSVDIIDYDYFDDILPEAAIEYYGFFSSEGARRDNKPIIINGEQYSSLANANDFGASFADIANYIEQNWEDL
jgi:hypothetical protein